MSAPRPILVLQMQRMGDLILSFPLFLWLARRFPGHPVWVVAERTFSAELMPVSPAVTYFPWEGAEFLLRESFHLVINLSIRTRAARLAHQVRAEEKIGPLAGPDGAAYIRGDWQLYRASVVRNNRHNRFHWAELNALDVIDIPRMAATRYDPPRVLAPGSRKVGVFFGASEAAKRPVVQFWQVLLSQLLHRGLEPVLFGGPGEADMAAEILRGFGGPIHNTCGRLSLAEIAALGQTLALFITPDTGPMHLAAWTGVQVLNLSMGNVNPWETGPYPPGHHVLSSRASCAGCWECRHPYPFCQWTFSPKRVAFLAGRLAAGNERGLASLRMPGVALYRTARNQAGLFHLDPVGPDAPRARDLLSDFWTRFWGLAFGACGPDPARDGFGRLAGRYPRLAERMRAALPRLARRLAGELARTGRPPQAFVATTAPMLRPLAGYLEMCLSNADHSPAARRRSLELVEMLVGVCGSAPAFLNEKSENLQ